MNYLMFGQVFVWELILKNTQSDYTEPVENVELYVSAEHVTILLVGLSTFIRKWRKVGVVVLNFP